MLFFLCHVIWVLWKSCRVRDEPQCIILLKYSLDVHTPIIHTSCHIDRQYQHWRGLPPQLWLFPSLTPSLLLLNDDTDYCHKKMNAQSVTLIGFYSRFVFTARARNYVLTYSVGKSYPLHYVQLDSQNNHHDVSKSERRAMPFFLCHVIWVRSGVSRCVCMLLSLNICLSFSGFYSCYMSYSSCNRSRYYI